MSVSNENKLKKARRRRLALLIPGHNEELIIETTIRSAIAGGLQSTDIYVVDDDSSDRTREIALGQLPANQVLTVQRSGKAGAVKQAIEEFGIVGRYTWVHIADADSVFCPDYFRIYKNHLNAKQHVAAVGFVQSMRGNWIATYRSFSYTYGQHIFRRLQSWAGVISVLPGPVTCFKTDIIKRLNFGNKSLTEDFDLTLQIHRGKLGRIKFIPDAVNFTQDPRTLKDFYIQTLRWQRGFFQGVQKYNIARQPHLIDISLGYQVSESVYYLLQLFIITPLLVVATKSWETSAAIVAADYMAVVVLAIFSATVARRPIILASLMYFYFLRAIELFIFMQAFIEVIILRRYRGDSMGWQTEGRRFALAIKDVKTVQ